MSEIGKLWYSVELTKGNADTFKQYLYKNNIQFEPSECYNLIHFECAMTKEELEAANDFLQRELKEEY